jgi:hypothetical protein
MCFTLQGELVIECDFVSPLKLYTSFVAVCCFQLSYFSPKVAVRGIRHPITDICI